MIRKTGIKIRIEHCRPIGYTATPISQYWQDRFSKHMAQYADLHGHTENLSEVFFQGSYELPETITTNRQFSELERGWPIVILVDPWEYGHWLGYDACNA